MPSQLVVGDLGQVLLQLLDHQFGGGLAQCVLELCDDARGSNEHELIEFPILELSGKLGRHGADEVVLGGLVQIAARLDRVTGGRGAFLDPRRAITPKLVGALVQLRGDEARQRPESAFLVALRRSAPARHRR